MSTVREELEEAWNPNDMVLAVIPDTSQSAAACDALRDAGFPEEDIALFQGREAKEQLDMEGKRTDSPLVRSLRAVWSYFSIEGPQLRTYEQASEAGQDIIAVKTMNDEEVATAHELLVRFNATEIRYFTNWNITDLPKDRPAA